MTIPDENRETLATSLQAFFLREERAVPSPRGLCHQNTSPDQGKPACASGRHDKQRREVANRACNSRGFTKSPTTARWSVGRSCLDALRVVRGWSVRPVPHFQLRTSIFLTASFHSIEIDYF